jgi:hypothetical protein
MFYVNTYVSLWRDAELFLKWEMLHINVVDKIRTHISYSATFFFFRKLCRLWDNAKKYGRAGQATDDNIRRMRIAWWIIKVMDTRPEYVILIAFPQQQWYRERASMLRYTYTACLVFLLLLPTCCRLEISQFDVRQGQRFFPPPKTPDRLWGVPNLQRNGYWGPVSPRTERQGHEADQWA